MMIYVFQWRKSKIFTVDDRQLVCAS